MYSHAPKNYVCPFCLATKGEEREDILTKQQDIVYRDAFVTAFVAAGWWPKNKGHVLIVPNNHAENIYDIDDAILGKVYAVAKEIACALKVTYNCEGTSLRQHNEPMGGQDVWHFHVHVFPRYTEDELYETEGPVFEDAAARTPYVQKLRAYFAAERSQLNISHTFSDYPCPICPATLGIENETTYIKKSDIVFRDETTTAFISSFFKENNPGHVIIVPNTHYENVYSLPDEVSNKIQSLAKRVAFALKVAYHCDGISTAQHNEPAGDQHAFHYHFHVFPRYLYDDLYKHIHEKTLPTPEERARYAQKLRPYFV